MSSVIKANVVTTISILQIIAIFATSLLFGFKFVAKHNLEEHETIQHSSTNVRQ